MIRRNSFIYDNIKLMFYVKEFIIIHNLKTRKNSKNKHRYHWIVTSDGYNGVKATYLSLKNYWTFIQIQLDLVEGKTFTYMISKKKVIK